MSEDLICFKCQVPLVMTKTNFSYLRHQFSAEVPRCPQCGLVYVSEELVESKMVPVEQLVEEK